MIAGPTGLVSAISKGNIARSPWGAPNESQDIQAKKATQQTPETVKMATMVELFHEKAVLPPS